MRRKLCIGTRSSDLAVWQARFIQGLLEHQGIETEICPIKSDGEADLVSPLYAMGIQGVFTRALDIAILEKRIDIAVHSLKDVPTQFPQGITLCATPKRDNHLDILVYKDRYPDLDDRMPYVVATSSLRRRAQWLHRYPHHQTDVIRGNINTRLEKLSHHPSWNGALFATAGMDRLQLPIEKKQIIDWMLPAPAQGTIAVMCREQDTEVVEMCKRINHADTFLATSVERAFLNALMGGCSMPIGAYAYLHAGKLFFSGNILTIDGKEIAEVQFDVDQDVPPHDIAWIAKQQIMQNGGENIVSTLKQNC